MTLRTIVAVEGASASGKTITSLAAGALTGGATIPEAYVRLGRRFSLEYRTPGALVRIERRLFREDQRRWERARLLARRGRTVYLDTGLFGTLTYTWGLVRLGRAPASALKALVTSFERAASERRIGFPDRIAYLDVAAPQRRRRAARDAVGHPAGLRELHQAVGALERELWLGRWAPMFGERFDRIDARRPAAEVADRLAEIGRLPPRGSSRATPRSDRERLPRLVSVLSDGLPLPGSNRRV